MNMLQFCIVSILIIIICVSSLNSDKVQDYVDLINDGVQKSYNYKLPKDNRAIYPEDVQREITDYGTYDFVVVGGGSAGAIVAKRLSENRFKTLLIEAGKQETDFNDIPGVFKNVQFSEYNWGYYTKSQKNICQGMVDQMCFNPRGKSLGGTGTLNGMAWTRGNKIDQDSWSKFGIIGWSWNDMVPYHKKVEDYSAIGTKDAGSNYRGFSGPIGIDYDRPANFLVNVFLNANEEIYQVSEDYNGPNYMAAGKVQLNKRNGKRQTSNRCYLSEYNNYLTITTESYATKVMIKNNKAVGIQFVKGNKRYLAKCLKEVIVSGGTINTPQLLMLSGIGPKEDLAKHQIPLVKDLPVGRHFEEHLGFAAFGFESTYKAVDSSKTLEEHVWEYFSGTGRLTATAAQAIAFISTVNNLTYPDIEVMINPQRAMFASSINEYNYKQETIDTFAVPPEKLDYVFAMTLILLHPKSKGTVTLKSSNPRDFPIIDPNALGDSDDAETLYKGVDYIMKLLQTESFKKYEVKLLKRILPACRDYEYLSRDYWMCTMRYMTTLTNHGIGTSRMGRTNDIVNSVVDCKLKVHGIKGLRIADLSVVPKSVSGHTQALAMAIGEKAADLICKDYQ